MSISLSHGSEENQNSASRMCKSNDRFQEWADERGIFVDRDEQNPDLHQLVRISNQTFKPPLEFLAELRTVLAKAKSDDKPFIQKMLTHYEKKPAAPNGDEEADSFRPSMKILVQALKRFRQPITNESTLRKTGDAILADLVDHLDDSFVATRAFGASEVFVRLPYRDKRYQVRKARFDEALLVELKDDGPKDAIIRELLNSEFQYKMEALLHDRLPAETLLLHVPLINVEYKKGEEMKEIGPALAPGMEEGRGDPTTVTESNSLRDWALNQVSLHLATALLQRKALGFDNMPAFGATVVGNDLRLYVAELAPWADGDMVPDIKVRFQKRYSMNDGVEICDVFTLLRHLLARLIGDLEVQYSQLKPLAELKVNLENFRWRVPDTVPSSRGATSLLSAEIRSNLVPNAKKTSKASSSTSQKRGREDEDKDAPSKRTQTAGTEPGIQKSAQLSKSNLRSLGSVERSSSKKVAFWIEKCLEEEFLDPATAMEAPDDALREGELGEESPGEDPSCDLPEPQLIATGEQSLDSDSRLSVKKAAFLHPRAESSERGSDTLSIQNKSEGLKPLANVRSGSKILKRMRLGPRLSMALLSTSPSEEQKPGKGRFLAAMKEIPELFPKRRSRGPQEKQVRHGGRRI